MNSYHSPRGGRLASGMIVIPGMMSPTFARPGITRGTMPADPAWAQVDTQSRLERLIGHSCFSDL